MDENEDIGIPAPGDVYAPTDLGYSDTTEEVQDWQNVDNGGTMEGWKYQDGVWTDPAGKSYDLSHLNVKDKGALSQLLGYAKKMLGGKGTTEEYMQLLPLLGGLFGANQSSNSSILNPGYQGGIPRVTATRTMLTEPPAGRRPGSGGINYGGDVTYARTGENLSAENAGISTPVSQPLGGSSGGAGGAGTQPAVTDLAGLIALLQQLGITVPGQGGQAPAPGAPTPGAPTPGAPTPSPSFAPARRAAPNEPSIMGTIGGGPDSSNPNDPWYLAHQNEGWEYKNLMGTKGWIKTRPDEPKDAWGAATAQQRREALKGVVQPLIPYDINTPGVKEVVEKFNAANPMPASVPAAPVAPQTPSYVGDIQSWYKQNQGGTQEDLNKFLSTSGYSAQQLNEALPQYGVSDLEKAIAAAKGTMTAAKGGLLPNGFVIPADVVSHLGNGSSEAGLELLAEELGAKPIKGDGDGMSDSIPTTIGGKQPARVANEEAFVPPDVVKKLGGGDTDRGAKKLYAMMDRIRKARTGTTEQGKQINPEKFMPGGKVDKYAVGGTTTSPTAGITSSSLADWIGPYVADMLGKGQALTEMPYTAYTGPLTAGASPLQQQAFQAAGNLQVPSQYGQAAGIAGGLATLAPNLRYTPQTTDFLGRPNVSGIDVAPSYGMTQQAPMAPQSRQMPAPGGAVADPWDITRSVGHPGFNRIAIQEAAQPGFKDRAPMPATTGEYTGGFDQPVPVFDTDPANYGQAPLQKPRPSPAGGDTFQTKPFQVGAGMDRGPMYSTMPVIMDDSGMGPETVGSRPAYGDVIMGPSRYDPVTGMATRDYGPIKPGDSHYDAYFKATYGNQAGAGQAAQPGFKGRAPMPVPGDISYLGGSKDFDESGGGFETGFGQPIQMDGGMKGPGPMYSTMPVIMDDGGMYPGAKPPMISDEFKPVPETFSTMPVDGNLFQITGPDRAPAGDRMPKPDYSTMPVPTGGPTARGLPAAPMPSQQPSNIAQQYMNPYIESVVSPQLRELTRQADIARGADAARMAKAGAFGGSRQAIMEAEGRRNLMQQQSDVLGQGYATAYDKAMAQFNADQARRAAEAQFGATYGMQGVQTGLQGAQTLGQLGSLQQQSTIDNLRALAEAGKTQRDIEAEGIAADKAQFEEARLNPYKMLQFQQSLLSGLPLASQSLVQPGQSNLQQFAGGFTTVAQMLQALGLFKK